MKKQKDKKVIIESPESCLSPKASYTPEGSANRIQNETKVPVCPALPVLGLKLTIENSAADKFTQNGDTLNLILNAALDAIICIDTNGDIIFWNPQAEKIFGWQKGEVIEKKLSSLIIPEPYRQRHDEGMDGYAKTGEGPVLNKLLELSALKRNGEEFPIELTIMPIKQGTEVFFCAFIRDITERKKADEILQATYAEKNIILESIADAFFAVDKNWVVTYWNKEAEKMLRTPKNEIVGRHLWEVFSNSIDSTSYKKYHQAIETNQAINFEDYYLALDRWFEISAYPSPTGLSVYFKDVTERKTSEAELLKIYKEKNTILDSIDDGFFTIDNNSLVTYWNRRAEILLGEKREDIIGRNLHEMFAQPDSRVFYENYQKALREKSTVHFEGFSKRCNKWFAVSAFASDNGLSVYFKDVTEQKKKEEIIRESELRYRSLIEQATDTICIADASLKFVEVNPSGCKMFGYSREEILQLHVADILFPEDLKRKPIKVEAMRAGMAINHERRFKRKDGSSVYVEINGKMLEDGKFIIFGRDISERKTAENKIKNSEARYRSLFEQNMAGVYQSTMSGEILNCNDAFAKMLKYDSPAEILQVNASALYFSSADRNDFTNIVLSQKKINNYESVLKCKDGSPLFFIENITVRIDEVTGEKFFDGIIIDITEKKQAEILLKESNDRYNLVSMATNDMVWDWDLLTGNVYRNKEGWKKLFRTVENNSENGFIDDWDSRIHPDDLDNVKKVSEEILLPGQEFIEVECRVRRDDGSYAYVHDRGNIIRNEEGKALRVIGATQDITERKEAELQVVKSEARFRSLVQNSSDLISILDENGYYLYSSPAVKEILGYEPEFIIGKDAFSFIHPDDIITIKTQIEKKDKKSHLELTTFRFKNAEGAWRWLESKVTDMTENPEVRGYILNSRDVTEKIIAREALLTATKFLQQTLVEQVSLQKKTEESESKLKEAQALAQLGYWDLNFTTQVSIWSEETCKIYGLLPGENVQSYESWLSFVHPEDLEYVKSKNRASEKTLCDTSLNHRIILRDGTIKYIASKNRFTVDEHGQAVGKNGILHDVTESKIAIEEINKLSIIARETVNAVIITDPQEKIIWANEAFTRITEFELEEVLGKKPADFLQGDETSQVVVRYMRNEVKKIKAFDCDIINYSKSGRKYWIRIQSQPQFDETGKLKYFFAIQTDITKEKQAEEILKASEERYRYLFNNNPACIFIWDLHSFKILEINETAVTLYGYDRKELLAMTILDLCLPEDCDVIKKYASRARQKIDFRLDFTGRRINKAGQEMYMSIGSHRIIYKGHDAILTMGTNITDKIILENELENERNLKQHEITDAVISAQEHERQEMGAELHDNINQILAGSLLYLGLAKEELKIEHPYLQETSTLIGSAISEIRNLSHALIPPSLHESELLVSIEHIIELTQKTSGIMINLFAEGIDETTIPDKLKLNIYRVIQEQFNNILKHAGAQKIIVRLEQYDKKTKLSIKDDGVGYDINKKANGVGLMNIKTRASLFDGEVSIISSPGQGYELKVLFYCC